MILINDFFAFFINYDLFSRASLINRLIQNKSNNKPGNPKIKKSSSVNNAIMMNTTQ